MKRILTAACYGLVIALTFAAGLWYWSHQEQKKKLQRIEKQYDLTPGDINEVNKAFAAGKTVDEIATAAKRITDERLAERTRRMKRFTARLHLQNLQLELSNLEIEEHIAELEGKPFNHSRITTKRSIIAQELSSQKLLDDLDEMGNILNYH